jgi:molecular chaperone DnaK
MERIIGIDLGTTNSVVAYLEQGQPVVIQNAEGSRTTPSVVLYKSADEILVGELAKRQAVSFPTQTIRSVKRFMGMRFSEVTPLMANIPYHVVEGPNDTILIDVGWTQISPEQVSADILKKMRSTAEEFFGESIQRAVVTVPAYFNDSQRSSTKRAGELAGLDILRIINEPTAAALAYGIDKAVEQRLAVFDLGGGTFDTSILEINKDLFEVRSTRGNTLLGGDNFDADLLQLLLDQFQAEHGIDLSQEPQALQRMKEAAETAKCELSSSPETLISLPFIAMGDAGPMHLQMSITREKLEEVLAPYGDTLVSCCEEAVSDSGIRLDKLDSVILVGGSTRIPWIQALVRKIFQRDPIKSVNPDEAVAIGAAIQGAILSGSLREVLLLDVTPLSLGIELSGGIFAPLIPRNSSIPTAHTRTFTTVKDNQNNVKVHVLQGERKVATENHSLGVFKLEGITPAPKEIPAIHVTFSIDANGILHVQAMDVTSGTSNAVSIQNYAASTTAKADEALREAEEAADEDRKYVRLQFIKRQADHLIDIANEFANDPEYPLPAHLIKQVRETAFRLDVATAGRDMEAADRHFAVLKELGSELEGHAMMVKHRRTSLSDSGDVEFEISDLE